MPDPVDLPELRRLAEAATPRRTTAICMCGATWTCRNTGRLVGKALRVKSCLLCDPSTEAVSLHENDGFGWCAFCGHAWPCAGDDPGAVAGEPESEGTT